MSDYKHRSNRQFQIYKTNIYLHSISFHILHIVTTSMLKWPVKDSGIRSVRRQQPVVFANRYLKRCFCFLLLVSHLCMIQTYMWDKTTKHRHIHTHTLGRLFYKAHRWNKMFNSTKTLSRFYWRFSYKTSQRITWDWAMLLEKNCRWNKMR